MCEIVPTITVGAGYDTAVEIANLFGYSRRPKGIRTGGLNHRFDDNVVIWWPTCSEKENGGWINTLNAEETQLVERSIDPRQTQELLTAVINGRVFHKVSQRKKVYVFAQVLPRNSRKYRYYFKGIFIFNKAASNAQIGLVWNKTGNKVRIYPPVSIQP